MGERVDSVESSRRGKHRGKCLPSCTYTDSNLTINSGLLMRLAAPSVRIASVIYVVKCLYDILRVVGLEMGPRSDQITSPAVLHGTHSVGHGTFAVGDSTVDRAGAQTQSASRLRILFDKKLTSTIASK